MNLLTSSARDSALSALLARVQARTGLEFPDTRMATTEPVVRRAMANLAPRDLARLSAAIDTDDVAFDTLIDALTVGETYFFRDARQLAFLRDHAIPDILHHRTKEHVFRAWSAGCASGEEPYSLAILCHELGLGERRRIVGTDISRRRLAVARNARYGRWSLRGVAADIVDRYFRCSQLSFALDQKIRDAVQFEYLNLGDEVWPSAVGGELDLIVCRNVLIYLDSATTARVGHAFMERLADGGWLLLGPSDPPLPATRTCEVVITDAGLAYRRGRRTKGLPLRVTPRSTAILHPMAADVPVMTVAAAAPSNAMSEVPSPALRSVSASERDDAGLVQLLDALKANAASSLARRDYGLAAEQAQRYVTERAVDEEGWIILVRALSNGGAGQTAGIACAAALEIHPLSAELMLLQSLILTELGQHQDALAAARRALFLDRQLVVAHLACGNALIHVGDPRAARRTFTNALRLLATSAAERPVPASGGELPARLAMLARSQLRLLDEAAP